MTKSYILHELKDYALISVGVILYAMGVTVFMLPYSLTTGGVAGVVVHKCCQMNHYFS